MARVYEGLDQPNITAAEYQETVFLPQDYIGFEAYSAQASRAWVEAVIAESQGRDTEALEWYEIANRSGLNALSMRREGRPDLGEPGDKVDHNFFLQLGGVQARLATDPHLKKASYDRKTVLLNGAEWCYAQAKSHIPESLKPDVRDAILGVIHSQLADVMVAHGRIGDAEGELMVAKLYVAGDSRVMRIIKTRLEVQQSEISAVHEGNVRSIRVRGSAPFLFRAVAGELVEAA